MVVFTCQHCNSSLRRSGIEKHYMHQCKRKPALTCMDCLKDFLGDEYIGHLTCVTEAERYGGANYVAKPVGVKQNKWLDICSQVLEKRDLSNEQRSLIKIIMEYPNIPRNRKKFHNFVANVGQRYRKNSALIDSVFDCFEQANKQQREAISTKSSPENGIKRKRTDSTVAEEVDTSVSSDTSKATRRQNQDKKKKESFQESVEEDNTSEGHVKESESTEKMSKKEKKRMEKLIRMKKERNVCNNDQNDSCILEEGKNESVESNLSKKEIKRIKKEKMMGDNQTGENKENDCDEVPKDSPEAELTVNPSENNNKMSKKERKRKLKEEKYKAELESIQNSEPVDRELAEDEIESKSKRKKMKKKNAQSEAVNGQSEEGASGSEKKAQIPETEEIEGSSKPGKFNWEEIIIEVLKSTSDHELSLKKLGKKVITEYQFRKGGEEDYEKVLAKFNKKIHKTIGVRVLKDRAKLIPS